MLLDKHERKRIRILVKAFPQPSTKYEETVCCAGVTEDGQSFLRLYPIRFRRLEKSRRFDRYDLVEMRITKASDSRPESYRVDENSICIVESKRKLPDDQKVKIWSPFIAPSLTALSEDNLATGRSLGVIRPDPDSVRFRVKSTAESGKDDQELARLVQQASLLEEPLRPLEPPEYGFSYEFTSGGRRHHHQIHDWEVQAAYLNYQRQYGSKEKALAILKQEYETNIPRRNLHFIMGTMASHRQTFILIGLLRSPLDPAELGRQSELF